MIKIDIKNGGAALRVMWPVFKKIINSIKKQLVLEHTK